MNRRLCLNRRYKATRFSTLRLTLTIQNGRSSLDIILVDLLILYLLLHFLLRLGFGDSEGLGLLLFLLDVASHDFREFPLLGVLTLLVLDLLQTAEELVQVLWI